MPLSLTVLRNQRLGQPREVALARLPASSTHRGNWEDTGNYWPGDVVASHGANWVWTVETAGHQLQDFDELVHLHALVPLSDPQVYRTLRARQLEVYVERCRTHLLEGRVGRPPRDDLRLLNEEECDRAYRSVPVAIIGGTASPAANEPAPPPSINEPVPLADARVMDVMRRGMQAAYRQLGEAHHDFATNFTELASNVLEHHISAITGVAVVAVAVTYNSDVSRYRFEINLELQSERRIHQIAFSVTPDFLRACRTLQEGQSLEITLTGPNHPAFSFRIDHNPDYPQTRSGRLRSSSPNLQSVPTESVAQMADRIVSDARSRVPRRRAPAKEKTSAKAPTEVFPWEEV